MKLSPSTRTGIPALACVALLALSACGSTTEETNTAPAPAPASSAASSAPTAVTATPSPKPSASHSTHSATPSPRASVVTVAPSDEPTSAAPTDTASVAAQPSETPVPAVPEASPNQPQPTETPVQAIPEASSPEAATTPACNYNNVRVAAEVSPGGGAAGSRYLNLEFTNTGNAPCSLSGYPGVNYVDADGNQIGSAATKATEWIGSSKVVPAGQSAKAILRETRAGLYDAQTCQAETSAGYRVTIPGTSDSLVLNMPAEACSSNAVSQLSVGQIGATP